MVKEKKITTDVSVTVLGTEYVLALVFDEVDLVKAAAGLLTSGEKVVVAGWAEEAMEVEA
jgi:hypothetical protein